MDGQVLRDEFKFDAADLVANRAVRVDKGE